MNAGLGEFSRLFRCNRLTLNLKKRDYVYFRSSRGGEVPRGATGRERAGEEGGGGPDHGCVGRGGVGVGWLDWTGQGQGWAADC